MIALHPADDHPDARLPGSAASRALDRRQRNEVPPDVTNGRVVVVVGGKVVGVVVGVVTEGEPDAAAPPLSAEGDEPVTGGAMVGGGDVVVVVVVAAPPEPDPDAGDGADAPGCSRATRTPRKAVAPPAMTTTVWVSRRRRRCARARVAGEKRTGARRLVAVPGVRARARVGGLIGSTRDRTDRT
jgi:hypothetical protein